jgi:hypothetical protein
MTKTLTLVDPTHQHTVVESKDRPFSGCVADPGDECDPVSHGGVCIQERCACGARRHSNSNAGHVEEGDWHDEDDE